MTDESLAPIATQAIPQRQLNSGAKIPAIGLGTFGSDHVSSESVAAAVEQAIMLGYRHIDCAAVYGNEKEIGDVLSRLFDQGVVKRGDLWVTSKLWNDQHAEEDVPKACRQSIDDLRVGYLDLYLIHWPFPNVHPKGCDVSARSPDAKPFGHENYLRTWRQLERLVELGLVKNIGTSNMTHAKLDLLLKDAKIRPAVNQMELHPHFQQPELFSYLQEQGILPVGFCPVGSPQRPERDKTPDDTSPTEDPVMQRIASRHGIHPATLCVKWAAQRGQLPIPFSTNPRNMRANLESLLSPPLSQEEMQEIASIDKGCRLIKGQVFLWEGANDWHDLWDEDGAIAQ